MYVPGNARVGEPTPQSAPGLFTLAELESEFRYLARLCKRYGWHELRAAARVQLLAEIGARRAAGEVSK